MTTLIPVLLTPQEHAHVMAALRFWQTRRQSEIAYIERNYVNDQGHTPMTPHEIDALCQRLNDPHAQAEEPSPVPEPANPTRTLPSQAALTVLLHDMWWFIENVPDTDPTRTDRFFTLRERYRAATA